MTDGYPDSAYVFLRYLQLSEAPAFLRKAKLLGSKEQETPRAWLIHGVGTLRYDDTALDQNWTQPTA